MNRTSIIIGTSLLAGMIANANIIATNTGVTGAGAYVWTYDFSLSSDQNANAGLAPTSNPVPHVNLNFGAFLTLYDFAGYVSGTCTGPSGWTCTAQNVGFTPDDVIPVDNPNLVNLTWTYTSGSTILGQPNGVDLGTFAATSTYNLTTQVSYASRGIKNLGLQAGTISDNVGNTTGPTNTPEPASAMFIGTGLIGLACFGRRLSRSN